MIRLILVRHGDTEWTRAGRYAGQADVPLSALGRAQAAATASILAREEVHAVYASDLSRAGETAEAIAAPHGLAVQSEPRLRELSFGDWEGCTYTQLCERWPDVLAAWQADPLNVPPPNGETLGQMAERVRAALRAVAQTNRDRTVVVVAHAGPLRVLLCQGLALPPQAYWQFRMAPGSISEITFYDEGAIVSRLNDTCHLPAETTSGVASAR